MRGVGVVGACADAEVAHGLQAGWVHPRGDAAPVPTGDGSWEVLVSCRHVSPHGEGEAFAPTVHPVTVRADWSVVTPHRLADLRRAIGPSGRASCLDLVDRVVPALHDLVQLRSRRRVAGLTRTAAGRWRLTRPAAACECASATFPGPVEAAAHERTTEHLAARYGADATVLARLVGELGAAYDGFEGAPPEAWDVLPLVAEPDGLDVLWAAGVPPDLVATVVESVRPPRGALPVEAVLGAVFHSGDLAWLSGVVRAATTVHGDREVADVAAWAAWSYGPTDRTRPLLRAAWVACGVSRPVCDSLVAAGVLVEDAEDLAEATGRTLVDAAELLAAWERVGCRLAPGDLLVLDRAGVTPEYRPHPVAVEALVHTAERLRCRVTRTQLAVLLGLAGSRSAVVRLLTDGVVDVTEAARRLGQPLGGESSTRYRDTAGT